MLTLKNLQVKDAYTLDLIPSLIVQSEEDFSEVVRRFATMPEVRGIFVADTHNHLLGVITRRDLLDWSRLRIGAFLHAVSPDINSNVRLANMIGASTAGQIMHPQSRRAAVTANDSLADALKLMIDLDLLVLPVVDDHNHIVEDLKLDEILSLIAVEEMED